MAAESMFWNENSQQNLVIRLPGNWGRGLHRQLCQHYPYKNVVQRIKAVLLNVDGRLAIVTAIANQI